MPEVTNVSTDPASIPELGITLDPGETVELVDVDYARLRLDSDVFSTPAAVADDPTGPETDAPAAPVATPPADPAPATTAAPAAETAGA